MGSSLAAVVCFALFTLSRFGPTAQFGLLMALATTFAMLANQFLIYLEQVNPALHQKVRVLQGEPFMGRGHQRIIGIGLAIPPAAPDVERLHCAHAAFNIARGLVPVDVTVGFP